MPQVETIIYLPEDGDIDQPYAEVQSKGVAIEREIETRYWGDRVFALRDPDGYLLAFAKTVQEVPMDDILAASQGNA